MVSYLVRSAHALLQEKLGWPAGLADPRVCLLDPAAGEMTFVRAAWREAMAAHRGGALRDLLRDHLLVHFTGIELLAPTHARGVAALRRWLRAVGCNAPAESLPALLADALAPPAAILAQPCNVILGNPPWRGRSRNRGAWITGLLRGYPLPDGRQDEGCFRVDGEPLGERNPKWLHDDYVKFLRLAQYLIDRNGEGVAALVLNHNGLDAPTFRGLRRSLLRSFEEIYALDLHGNARRRETDENVFPGVAQGAALLLLVKKPGLRPRVLRADLHGSRRDKLRALRHGDVRSTPWCEISPRPPAYLFVAGDRAIEREYERGLPLPAIFPVYGPGIVTGRDALVTALDRKTLERRIAALREAPAGLSSRRREEMRRDTRWRQKITRYLARPFDLRHILYAGYLLERPRRAVMEAMRGDDNLGLIVPRQSKEEPGALVTRWPAGHKVVSACDVSSLFPLYLGAGAGRRPNLAPGLAGRLGDLYGEEPAPEAILGYVYAVLYSLAYRRRYRELLRRSFPRISFPEDRQLFARLAELGRELIGLHLLQDSRLREPAARLFGRGAVTRRRRYVETGGTLDLGGDRLALVGVEPQVWAYRIGAYRVLDRWTQARVGRALSAQERCALPQIAEALRLTLDVQSRIDGVLPERSWE